MSARVQHAHREPALPGASAETAVPGSEPEPVVGKRPGNQEDRRARGVADAMKGEAGAVGRDEVFGRHASIPLRRADSATIEGVGEMGKLLLVAGLVLAALGGLLLAAARLGIRRIPGTIVVSGKHVTFIFPLILCLVLSIVLTLILSFWRR